MKTKQAKVIVPKGADLTMKKMGDFTEVTYIAKKKTQNPIKTVSKDKYIDTRTGEIKERKQSKNREENKKGIIRSIARLRDIIKCNIKNDGSCVFVTLTYEKPMTNYDEMIKDFNNFNRRLRRTLSSMNQLEEGQKIYNFIVVYEPQGEEADNRWHLHLLLVFEDKAPLSSLQDIMDEVWGNGYTEVGLVKDVEGLVGYFNVTKDETPEDINKKTFIKASRLALYPTGKKLYSHSRGMDKPEKIIVKEEDLQQHIGEAVKVYETGNIVTTDDEQVCLNAINKRFYVEEKTHNTHKRQRYLARRRNENSGVK